MIFIMYDTEEAALFAADKVYLNYFKNYVLQRNNFDGSLLNVQTWEKTPYTNLSDSQLLETFEENGVTTRVYPILGENEGQLNKGAFTNYWDKVININDKWGIRKPSEAYLLVGVTGYTEENINEYIKYVPE